MMKRFLLQCNNVWRDRSGTAAVEFVMIAPILLLLTIGTVEVCNAIRVQAKLNVVVDQIAELVAGQPSITAPSGTLADICTGAALNLIPFPASPLSAVVMSLSNDHPSMRVPGSADADTTATYLDWEDASPCDTQAVPIVLATAFDLANTPTSLLTTSGTPAAGINGPGLKYGTSVLIVKAKYSYRNALMFFLGSTVDFSATAVVRPRGNAAVKCLQPDGTTPCPSV